MKFALLAVLLVQSAVRAEPQQAEGMLPPSLLVLRSGQVLQGKLQRQADRYRVDLLSGGHVSVPKGEVDFLAGSLREAYAKKLQHINLTSLDQQILLARWCWQQKLATEARRHLSQARVLAPHDSRVLAMERMVGGATERTSGTPQTDLAAAPVSRPMPSSPSVGVSRGEPPRMSREILQGFSRQIQPILLTRCGGCHSPDRNGSFVLKGSGRNSSNEVSVENLAAVQRFAETTGENNLAERARTAHAGSQPLSGREYSRHLLPWLALLANSRNAEPNRPRGLSIDELANTTEDPFSPALFHELPVAQDKPVTPE
jgi:hypothetical protein